jgi:hypothetical protein
MRIRAELGSVKPRYFARVKAVLLIACIAVPGSAQSLGKRTATEALRTIRTFADWYVYDDTSDLLDGPARKRRINPPPWNFCWPPDRDHPYNYSATLLDNAESTANLDELGKHELAERLSNRVLKYLQKHGYQLQPKNGWAGGCYEHNGAVVQVIQPCNGCSNFTKYPYDGVIVIVITPDD